MYRAIFILFAMLSSKAIQAQYQKSDSVVYKGRDTQFSVVQRYDTENKKVEIVNYEQINGAIEKTTRVKTAYDDKGNELEKVYSLWYSQRNAWEEEERTLQKFNDKDQLTQHISYQKKGEQWSSVFESNSSYVRDSIIEVNSEEREGTFQPTHKSITVNTPFGKNKTYEILLWKGESQKWEHLNRTENYYQNDTILIGSETIAWENNTWQEQEKIVYELDSLGHKMDNYTVYRREGEQWMATSKFEQVDLPKEKKQISRTCHWREEEQKWEVRSQIDTHFNSEGKKQDVMFWELDLVTNQLKLQFEQLHLYNKEGWLKLLQEFDHSNPELKGVQQTFKFDSDGNVIQEDLYEWNAKEDNWTATFTADFVFDTTLALDTLLEETKPLYVNELNEYASRPNTHAIKQVKRYQYQNGKKVLYEEWESFIK